MRVEISIEYRGHDYIVALEADGTVSLGSLLTYASSAILSTVDDGSRDWDPDFNAEKDVRIVAPHNHNPRPIKDNPQA